MSDYEQYAQYGQEQDDYNDRLDEEHKRQDAQDIDEAITIDQINLYCCEHYEDGGDIVIETMNDKQKLAKFASLEDLKEYIKLQQEYREETESTIW